MTDTATDFAASSDRLTGFQGRSALIGALTSALEPSSAPSVLAVFELIGGRDHRLLHGEAAHDTLIAGLAAQFAAAIGERACYRPRQHEFCALLAHPLATAAPMLSAASEALSRHDETCAITPFFGAVLLPDEAADALEALMLADERSWARYAAARAQRSGAVAPSL